MDINGLPNRVLNHAQKGIPNVMGNLAQTVFSMGIERPLTPIQQVESTVPKSDESKSNDQIN